MNAVQKEYEDKIKLVEQVKKMYSCFNCQNLLWSYIFSSRCQRPEIRCNKWGTPNMAVNVCKKQVKVSK